MSSSRAEHLRAHASRLLAFADRFRHGGYDAAAEDFAAQAARYLDAAAKLEAPDPSLLGAHLARRRAAARAVATPPVPTPPDPEPAERTAEP